MKKTVFTRVIFTTFMVLFLALTGNCSVISRASDSGDPVPFKSEGVQISGSILALDREAKAYASPSEDSEVLHEFSAGDTIFVSGQDGAFISIFYDGKTMYIKTDDITQEAFESSEEAAKAMEEELKEEAETRSQRDQAYLETLIRREEQKKKALIWKIIIGILVVAIIAVSVAIGISNNKKGK
ncbi:MAG: hypothetical protein II842_16625 [Butyrivibrio sp.]|nr:hypothetical protein [Butyrivibrio sp.]